MEYSIFNPTGNITALVESYVDIAKQPAAAADIMRRHPQVEQVGFVSFAGTACTENRTGLCGGDEPEESRAGMPEGEGPEELRAGTPGGEGPEELRISLRMAGGEFCGNAAMCAAALALIRKIETPALSSKNKRVSVSVSGVQKPIEVCLDDAGDGSFDAGVKMPAAFGVRTAVFDYNGIREQLPFVELEGITHIIIRQENTFFSLKKDKTAAEEAVRLWCGSLSAAGLGLMFLEGENDRFCLTPLVYIPGGETVFWENSCASGSTAAGIYLAHEKKTRVSLALEEPGGILRVESDPVSGGTQLYGKVKMVGGYSF